MIIMIRCTTIVTFPLLLDCELPAKAATLRGKLSRVLGRYPDGAFQGVGGVRNERLDIWTELTLWAVA